MDRIVIYYLAGINVLALVVYGVDKLLARAGTWRVPERFLIALGVAGGTVGGLMAMALFRHKTEHLLFRVGLPLILAAQIALAFALWLGSYPS